MKNVLLQWLDEEYSSLKAWWRIFFIKPLKKNILHQAFKEWSYRGFRNVGKT
jgi:hypothetical protein